MSLSVWLWLHVLENSFNLIKEFKAVQLFYTISNVISFKIIKFNSWTEVLKGFFWRWTYKIYAIEHVQADSALYKSLLYIGLGKLIQTFSAYISVQLEVDNCIVLPCMKLYSL